MNRIMVVLILMLAFFSSGCTDRSDVTQDISDDAVIVHLSYGAFTLPEMAVQELVVNETAVNLSYYGADRELTARYIRPINESVRNDLLDLFRENAFLAMEDSYEPVRDSPLSRMWALLRSALYRTILIRPSGWTHITKLTCLRD